MASIDTPLSLLDRVRELNDPEDWRLFSQLYEPLIRRWVGRLVSQWDAIDDIVQEALKALLEGLPGFRHNLRPGAFRSWLRSITINRIRRHWEARPLNQVRSSEWEQLQDPNSGLSRMWDEEHDRHVLKVLLERIRPEFDDRTWAIFESVVFDEAKVRDVAEDFETSANAIYIIKARVLKRLRLEGRGLIE
jgi:RNA polymerase sigma-70 factor (ECF subfamily)